MATVGYEIVDPIYYERYGYPHAAWAFLRRHAPVSWQEPPGMKPFWAITRHADVETISRDLKRFSIARRMAVFPEEEYSSENFPYRHLLTMDPPEHGKYRGLMSQRFTPKTLEPKRLAIGRIVDEVFDRIAGRTEVDFVEAVSVVVPLAAIAEMLGVPRSDWDLLFRLSNVMVGGSDPEFQRGATPGEAVMRAVHEMFDYFRGLSNERRGKEGDDFVTLLANARVDGKPIPDWELTSYYALLIVAGNETTRNANSGGLRALIEHPAELEKLRRDPSLVPAAVEEIVRWVTPVIQFCRTALEDVEIHGTRIRAGDACCLFYPSANRDEDVFADPFSFRVDRDPNEHFGFGIGAHFCLGANLARLELQEILKRVITRMQDIEPTGPVERVRSSFVGGIKRMPIRYRMVPA